MDLENAILEKRFRQDLYYRLNVVPIDIPPLRNHKTDIPALVKHLINKYNQEYGRNVSDISSAALERIMGYDWVGNVRELENFIGRTMINIKMHEHLITLNHLPQTLAIGNQVMTAEPEETILDSFELEENVMRFEKRHIELTLQKCQGNREETARLLGISLRSLYYKIKNLGI